MHITLPPPLFFIRRGGVNNPQQANYTSNLALMQSSVPSNQVFLQSYVPSNQGLTHSYLPPNQVLAQSYAGSAQGYSSNMGLGYPSTSVTPIPLDLNPGMLQNQVVTNGPADNVNLNTGL